MNHEAPQPPCDTGLSALYALALDTPGIDSYEHPGLIAAARHGYEALERIGEGGIAEVWRGVDQNTGRDVVLKVVKRVGDACDPQASANLEREAEWLAKLALPGVVSLLRKGGHDESRFVVLAYLEGGTLAEWIDRCRRGEEHPEEARLLALLDQLAKAVQDLHTAGVAHGDLKPSNVMLSAAGEVVLIDLGFCQKLEESQPTLTVEQRGRTPGYYPPQQASPWSARQLDAYALGKTMTGLLEASDRPRLQQRLSRSIRGLMDPACNADVLLLSRLRRAIQRQADQPARRRRYGFAAVLGLVSATTLAYSLLGAPRPMGSGIAGLSGSAYPAGLLSPDHASGPVEPMIGGTGVPVIEPVESLPLAIHFASAAASGGQGRWVLGDHEGQVLVGQAGATAWRLNAFQARVVYVGWSADQRSLIACDEQGQVVQLDAANADVMQRFVVPGCLPRDAVLQEHGLLRIIGSDDRLIDLDMANGNVHEVARQSNVILPDRPGKHWLRLEEGEPRRRLQLQDAHGVVWEHDLEAPRMPLAFDVQGDRIAVAFSEGYVLAGRIHGKTRLWQQDGYVRSVRYLEDSGVLLTVGKQVNAVDASTGRVVARLADQLLGIPEAVAWDAGSGELTVMTTRERRRWQYTPGITLASR